MNALRPMINTAVCPSFRLYVSHIDSTAAIYGITVTAAVHLCSQVDGNTFTYWLGRSRGLTNGATVYKHGIA